MDRAALRGNHLVAGAGPQTPERRSPAQRGLLRATPGNQMAQEPSRAQQLLGDLAPKMVQLTDDVLFGDVWKRNGLSPPPGIAA
jgi:hypothetical protein